MTVADYREALLRTVLELERLASHSGLSLLRGGGAAAERARECAAEARKLLASDKEYPYCVDATTEGTQ